VSNPLQGFLDWLEGTSAFLAPIVTATLYSSILTPDFSCSDNISGFPPPPSPLVYYGSARAASGDSALSVSAVLKDRYIPTAYGGWGFDTQLKWNGSKVELTHLDFGAPVPSSVLFGDPYHYGCKVRASILRNATISNNGETLELDFGIYFQSRLTLLPDDEDSSCKLLLQKGFLIHEFPIHI
jgi:hypothetical protein